MSTVRSKRIVRELMDYRREPLPGTSTNVDDANRKIYILIEGPDDSPINMVVFGSCLHFQWIIR